MKNGSEATSQARIYSEMVAQNAMITAAQTLWVSKQTHHLSPALNMSNQQQMFDRNTQDNHCYFFPAVDRITTAIFFCCRICLPAKCLRKNSTFDGQTLCSKTFFPRDFLNMANLRYTPVCRCSHVWPKVETLKFTSKVDLSRIKYLRPTLDPLGPLGPLGAWANSSDAKSLGQFGETNVSWWVGDCLWQFLVNPASFHPQQLGEGIFDHGEFGILTTITCLAADQTFRQKNDQTWQQKITHPWNNPSF